LSKSQSQAKINFEVIFIINKKTMERMESNMPEPKAGKAPVIDPALIKSGKIDPALLDKVSIKVGPGKKQDLEPQKEEEKLSPGEEYEEARGDFARSLKKEFGIVFDNIALQAGQKGGGLFDTFNQMHKYYSMLGRDALKEFYHRFDGPLLNNYLNKRIVYKKYLEKELQTKKGVSKERNVQKEIESEYYKAKAKAINYLRPINRENFDCAFEMFGNDLKKTLVLLRNFKQFGNFDFDENAEVIKDFEKKWQLREDYKEMQRKPEENN
jgi:hypothetical protein